MKKFSMMITVAACVLALAACGSKENVETEAGDLGTAAEETAAEAEGTGTGTGDEAVSLPEEYEIEIIEGTVTELKDNIVTVTDEEGTSLVFDITNAEQYDNEFLMTGAFVEVDYAIVDGDTYPAESITVLMDIEEQAANEDRDPVIWGTVQLLDINDLIIIDETGTERTFNNQMSRTVSFNDIQPGDRVQVTYAGSLFDDSDVRTLGIHIEAIKIVAEEALGSDEANADYLIGQIDTIYADVLTLDMEPETLEILIDQDMVADVEEGDYVKVYYTGSMSGISVAATAIEKIEN